MRRSSLSPFSQADRLRDCPDQPLPHRHVEDQPGDSFEIGQNDLGEAIPDLFQQPENPWFFILVSLIFGCRADILRGQVNLRVLSRRTEYAQVRLRFADSHRRLPDAAAAQSRHGLSRAEHLALVPVPGDHLLYHQDSADRSATWMNRPRWLRVSAAAVQTRAPSTASARRC